MNAVLNCNCTAASVRLRVRLSGLAVCCSVMLLSGCGDDAVEPHRVEVFPAVEQDSADSETLTLGIVPQQSPADIERNWRGLAEYLTAKVGKEILIKTAPSIPEFERRCANGLYDLSYMNPYHFTVYSRFPGYRAVARQKDKQIYGILVVRRDYPVSDDESLSRFDGQEVAFPAPAAFAASLLTRAAFEKENVNIDEVYVRTHDSVFEGVAKGIFPVGGGVVRTLKSMDANIQDQLRIYWKSQPHTPHAFAAHPRVSDDDYEKIQAALTALDSPASNPAVLQPIRFNGFVRADDEDWDDVRALNLDELEVGQE